MLSRSELGVTRHPSKETMKAVARHLTAGRLWGNVHKIGDSESVKGTFGSLSLLARGLEEELRDAGRELEKGWASLRMLTWGLHMKRRLAGSRTVGTFAFSIANKQTIQQQKERQQTRLSLIYVFDNV
jgi:hypothetical protein